MTTAISNDPSAQGNSTTSTVLAVGAAGSAAGLVVPELARRGATVRALVQRPGQADVVRSRGATEVAVGDLTDDASIEEALKGVDAVFYIAPAFIDDEAEIGVNMVHAAQRAGVRRFVFSSVIDPVIGALVNHSAKTPVEAAIIESDMEFSLLQPAMFMQNLSSSWPAAARDGVYAEPWSATTRFARVDYRDVAEVAAVALTEDRLLYGTFQLCAEGNLDRHDLAALMSDVWGTPVTPGGPARAGSASRQDPASPTGLMIDWYQHHGLPGNALILRAILGREPRTLRSYLEGLAAA